MITARWRNIAILSWPVPEEPLLPFVPNGLTLDRWSGEAYLSLVCLFMENVRFIGLPALPRRFAEINLRFYVRRAEPRDERVGVVFLRQMVSNRCVALAGRRLFREPMLNTTVSHQFETTDLPAGDRHRRLHYRWANGNSNEGLQVTARVGTYLAEPGSLDEFLTARHWGFNAQSDGPIRAYRISREPWSLAPVIEHELNCDVGSLCGPQIVDFVAGPPASALLATGSDTRIHWPTKLR